jgi:hypothetical protein
MCHNGLDRLVVVQIKRGHTPSRRPDDQVRGDTVFRRMEAARFLLDAAKYLGIDPLRFDRDMVSATEPIWVFSLD